MIYPPGATSVSVDVFFADDTGAALTGKVAADFPAVKWSGGSNTADTTITLSDLAAITTAHPNDNTAGGVKEREGGWYRLDLPNNVFTSAGHKTLTFAETTNKRILAPPIDVQYVQGDVRRWGGSNPNSLISGRVDANTQDTASTLTFTLTGDLTGKVLGGGAGTIAGTGVRAVDASGNAIATQTSVNAVAGLVWEEFTADHQTGGTFGQLGDLIGAYEAGSFAVASVTDLSGKFTGLSSVAHWLRAIARKDNNDPTAISEINANIGNGAGTFDPTTDSEEAISGTLAQGVTIIAGGITSASFAAGAINAAAIADGAIDAATFAAGAFNAIFTQDLSSFTTAGTAGNKLKQLTFTVANQVDSSATVTGGGDASAANQVTIIKLLQANTRK